MMQIWPLYTDSEINLEDRVLSEVEKKSCIALPDKGDHSRLMPSKLCFPTKEWGVLESRDLIADIDQGPCRTCIPSI